MSVVEGFTNSANKVMHGLVSGTLHLAKQRSALSGEVSGSQAGPAGVTGASRTRIEKSKNAVMSARGPVSDMVLHDIT